MLRKLIWVIKKVKSAFYTRLAALTTNSRSKFKANGFTKLSKHTALGINCHFNGMVINGKGKVKIGDNFHSGGNCRMITENHNYNGSQLPYDSTNILKDIVIEDNVWLGRDVTVLAGVKIGEGAIVQACSVVTSNISALAIAGGHPAVEFSRRDEKHYIKLKKLKRFH